MAEQPMSLLPLYNGEDQTYTRQWVIWHLIEHDLHHGGELPLR